MRAFYRLITILAVNIVLFLIAIILIEGGFRVAGIPYKIKYIPNENSFARFDPELGWSYLPGISAMHETGNIKQPVHFDTNGIRISKPGFQLDTFKPSVLFIGGSFTMGHGLSYEESFAGKFEALEEVPYQVVNLGVQGYGSDQALLTLKKYLTKFNTKAVVYTFIEDHILRNGSYDRRMLIPTAKFLGTKPLFKLDNEEKLYLEKKPVLYRDYFHSYLLDFIKIKLGTTLNLFPPFPEKLTKSIVNEMKNYCDKHGVHFIVINWRWTLNDYDELFHNLDINVIDTMKDAPENWEKMVLLGGIHPDAQAGDHAAELLLKHFRAKGLIK